MGRRLASLWREIRWKLSYEPRDYRQQARRDRASPPDVDPEWQYQRARARRRFVALVVYVIAVVAIYTQISSLANRGRPLAPADRSTTTTTTTTLVVAPRSDCLREAQSLAADVAGPGAKDDPTVWSLLVRDCETSFDGAEQRARLNEVTIENLRADTAAKRRLQWSDWLPVIGLLVVTLISAVVQVAVARAERRHQAAAASSWPSPRS